jgi:hypothetical protein
MQCHFFAMGDDLVPVFQAVEKTPLDYALFQHSAGPSCLIYSSGLGVPTLGVPAPDPNAINGYTYLVVTRGTGFTPRRIDRLDGSHRYSFDQLLNPKSVCLTHGGVFGSSVLLYGRVATASQDPESVRLQRRFSSAIRKLFRRVQAFWVGPDADRALRSGWRLTIGADSPREFDLVHPQGDV